MLLQKSFSIISYVRMINEQKNVKFEDGGRVTRPHENFAGFDLTCNPSNLSDVSISFLDFLEKEIKLPYAPIEEVTEPIGL